jgi:hypothetical protein
MLPALLAGILLLGDAAATHRSGVLRGMAAAAVADGARSRPAPAVPAAPKLTAI